MDEKKDGQHGRPTPGPWRVTTRPDGLGGEDVIVKAGQVHICDCFEGMATPEEERANARLIASAPELLAALDFIVQAARTEPGMSIYKAHLDQAEAAIRKAKGE